MCLKTCTSRLPLGEAGPKGLKGQEMKSRRPQAAIPFTCPLTAVAELSRGRAYSLTDFLICHEYISSISLIYAWQL